MHRRAAPVEIADISGSASPNPHESRVEYQSGVESTHKVVVNTIEYGRATLIYIHSVHMLT